MVEVINDPTWSLWGKTQLFVNDSMFTSITLKAMPLVSTSVSLNQYNLA